MSGQPPEPQAQSLSEQQVRAPRPTEVSPLEIEVDLPPSDCPQPETTSDERLTIGQRLSGRYRIERELGEGGMGVVYLVTDEQVAGETFAVKVLKEALVPETLSLLREEVRKTRKLSHPNIVDVHSVNVDGSRLYVLMEYLEGKSLDVLLDEEFGRGMAFSHAWPVIEDVGAALGYAHDHNVIHSDLKPANVFLTTSGKTKLLDFGIARVSRGPLLHQRSGPLALTPAYASCEMLQGKEADARDDVYSFACVIYEMLCGKRPFGEVTALEAREAGARLPPIGVLTREQNAALAQALAFDRKGRTPSVEELLVGLADKKPRARPIALLTGAIIAAVALGVIFWNLDWTSRHSIATPERTVKAAAPVSVLAAPVVADKSVAVLPFLDLSEKKDQEYFADGMAEEVINLLAKVPDLRVPARTSSFYFKGKPTTVADIAKALGVSHVLEGSVRKSADKLRVTVQLIRVDSGYHVWSDTYDRKLDDIFEVQDEIAGEVVKALKVSLGANEVLRDAPTKSTEAYQLLLKARSLLYRSAGAEPDDCKRAVGYYQQVVQLDPHAAVAWAELSEALLCQGRTVQNVRAPALQAAENAITADPLLADAHVALARIRYWFDWDWAAANVEYEKARQLDPANSHALTGAGVIALLRNSLSDAMRLLEQAVARDPLNASAISRLADIYFATGQFKDSAAGYRKTLELAPNWPGSHAVLSQALLGLGQQDAALAEAEKEPDPGYRAYALARTYIVLGHRADAESALSSYERTYASEQPYNIATLHALRGELDQAFSWLNRAYEQHDPSMVGYPPITVEPDVKNLRGDPRFKALLRKMKLPE